MEILGKTYYETPLGLVEISATFRGLYSLKFVEKPEEEIDPANKYLQECMEQLEEYFQGERMLFKLMLDIAGTDFQNTVWRELTNIPFAQTRSYMDVAKSIQSPDAVRAVGGACGKNRLWLVVPCHRVISSDGKLTGYAGGLARKRWLLEHERGVIYGKQTLLFND